MVDDAKQQPDQLQRVQAVTDAALAHLTTDGLLDELLIRVRELLGVDTAAVLLLDEERRQLVATAAKGLEEEVEQGVRLPLGRGFAGTIAARGEPVILEHVDHTKVLNPLLLRRGIRSMLGVPMIVAGTVIGVLHVGTLEPHRFEPEDVELLQLVADRIALALDTRRHQEDRFIAETLQRSLLPDRLPRAEDLEISGLYAPARGGMVGGDWYDVFPLPSGAICVVVGDTAGSGLHAAIAMARIRDALRALVFVSGSPGAALSQVNELIRYVEPDLMATAFVGILELDGTLRYASAGHLPPVLVHEDGTRLVEPPREPPLGAVYRTYGEASVRLDPGETLILYTDGLVERRGRSIDVGLERLLRASSSPWLSVDELCQRVLGGEVRGELEDDLAVLVLGRRAGTMGSELRLTFPAQPRELANVRRTLRRWFDEHRIPPQDAADLLLAIGEAAANAIEHAYGPSGGTVELHARIDAGEVTTVIRDTGQWREPRGTHRGRGRVLMSHLADELTVDTNEGGTTVQLRKRLAG